MKKMIKGLLAFAIVVPMISCGPQKPKQEEATTVKVEQQIKALNADEALQALKDGNQRFVENKAVITDYPVQIETTKTGQTPHTVFVSCMDSRVPAEIIFDQGIGNIFVIRNAGNIEDENALGGLEFATKVMGTKLIVVMGHNHCGAVQGALDDVKLGNLTQLVEQIKPAIPATQPEGETMLDATAKKNVELTIRDIQDRSEIVRDLVKDGSVKIVGAYYDIETGKVAFM